MQDIARNFAGHKFENYAELVGNLTEFKLVGTDLWCGGYCDFANKEIAYRNGGLETILHEIGHALQAKADYFTPKSRLKDGLLSLSWELYTEQEAEAIGYYLYVILLGKTPPKGYFSDYFKASTINYVKWWFDDVLIHDL